MYNAKYLEECWKIIKISEKKCHKFSSHCHGGNSPLLHPSHPSSSPLPYTVPEKDDASQLYQLDHCVRGLPFGSANERH